MRLPAIALSFDDHHVDEWYSAQSCLKRYSIKATFYVTHLETLEDDQWEKLRLMQGAGHTIACHGLRHQRAGKIFREEGARALIDKEIKPAIDMLLSNGLRADHYSYPRGNGSDETDELLLRYFKTLRYGGTTIYRPKEHGRPRIYNAASYGKWPSKPTAGHDPLVDAATMQQALVCVYMHKPMYGRIDALARIARKNGAHFLTMDEVYDTWGLDHGA
jgi:peptidoglycan/xylan/chitin deacetylase (PgdA/CDA1 family)